MKKNDPLAATPLAALEAGKVLWGPYERIARDKRVWQLLAFVLACLSFVFGLGLHAASRRQAIALHVVEVDRLGQARYVGPPRTSAAREHHVAAALAQFIRSVRAVFRDPRAVFEEHKSAYVHVTRPVRAQLERFFRDPRNDPRILGQRIWRSVQVDSVIPLAESAWQVNWIETEYNHHGGDVERSSRWTAVLEVELVTPRTAEEVARNPLGLYITTLSWTETTPQGETP